LGTSSAQAHPKEGFVAVLEVLLHPKPFFSDFGSSPGWFRLMFLP
jgi:hypothetical protein